MYFRGQLEDWGSPSNKLGERLEKANHLLENYRDELDLMAPPDGQMEVILQIAILERKLDPNGCSTCKDPIKRKLQELFCPFENCVFDAAYTRVEDDLRSI